MSRSLSPLRVRGTPTVIIVTGPPGAGKTTLARRLASDLSLPLITKDAIKESLFDSLGIEDVEWSKRLGRASMELLYLHLDTLLAAGQSAIVESNFHRTLSTPHFLDLQARHPFHRIQIVCTADGETLLRRFRERHLAGERHPGHHDSSREGDLLHMIEDGIHGPLPLDGPAIEVDTTMFEAIDYERLIGSVRQLIDTNRS